jgi:hypothetical protein
VQAAGAAHVNTATQQLGSEITSRQVVELPTLNRNLYALVLTAASVSLPPRSRRIAINGLRSAGTNVLLDGASNKDEFVVIRVDGSPSRRSAS